LGDARGIGYFLFVLQCLPVRIVKARKRTTRIANSATGASQLALAILYAELTVCSVEETIEPLDVRVDELGNALVGVV
jgi:hypothetical protein